MEVKIRLERDALAIAVTLLLQGHGTHQGISFSNSLTSLISFNVSCASSSSMKLIAKPTWISAYFPHFRFWNVCQADFLDDPAEVHPCHTEGVCFINFNYFSGDSQAHIKLPFRMSLRAQDVSASYSEITSAEKRCFATTWFAITACPNAIPPSLAGTC